MNIMELSTHRWYYWKFATADGKNTFGHSVYMFFYKFNGQFYRFHIKNGKS